MSGKQIMHIGLHMKNIRLMYLIVTLLAMIASHSVLARSGHGGGGGYSRGHSGGYSSHGHSRLNFGINLGGYYGPGFYGYGGYGGYSRYGYGGYGLGGYGYPFYAPPYYAYPPTVIVPSTPPVYIQQQQVQPIQPQTNYWYYCRNPDGYYPYVKNCPGGWLQVAPQPAQ